MPILEHALGLGFFAIPIAASALLHEQYIAPKWITLYAIAAAAAWFCRKGLVFPSSRSFWALSLAWTFAFIIPIAFHPEFHYEGQLLDGLAFTAIALTAYTIFSRSVPERDLAIGTIVSYNRWATLYMVALGALQAAGVNPFPRLSRNEFPSALFGFQNMTAEFIAISMLLQLHELVELVSPAEKKPDLWKWLLFAASAGYLYSLYCRAAWVALFAGLAILGLPRIANLLLESGERFFSRKVGMVFLGLVLFVFAFSHAPRVGFESVKERNVAIRLVRWRNTLQMIREHPEGIGPGNFELEYLNYAHAVAPDPDLSEGRLIRSPHNDYLRLVAELGWASGVLFLFSLGFVGSKIWRLRKHLLGNDAFRLSVALFGVVLALAIFAFPREEAYPFYVAAIALGLMLSEFAEKPRPSRAVVCVALALAIATLGSGYALSRYWISAQPRDLKTSIQACRIFPSYWWSCLMKARNEFRSGALDQARDATEELLRSSAGANYYAHRLLADIAQARGDQASRCHALVEYDRVLPDEKTFKDELASRCQGFQIPR